MYVPGTKCVITWTVGEARTKVGDVVTVGSRIVVPIRDCPEWADEYGLLPSEMVLEHQESSQSATHVYFHPTAWMLPLNPDTESLYDTKELENI